MKLRLLLLTMFSVPALMAGAARLTITVQDFNFSPNTATINLGDTIVFSWVNGSHTTTSKTIPGGAVSWDQPMNSANTSFEYVPAVAGVYNYVCKPHEAMGHIGSFTVVGTTGITVSEQAKDVFDIYPNPAGNQLTLALHNEYKKVSITLSDISGRKMILKDNITGKAALDMTAVPDGIYFVQVIADGKRYVRKLTVRK